jgi:hypothetical protein
MFRSVALILILAASSRLAAQGGSDRIRAQERVVDSLVANRRQAIAALQAFDDSVTRARVRMDTLTVGSLRFRIEPTLRERAERAARVAAARIDSVAGAGARRFAGSWLIVRGTGPASGDTLVVSYTLPFSKARALQEMQTVWGPTGDSTLVEWMYDAALRALGETVDAPMLAWQRGVVRPDSVTTTDWLGTRLDVVSSSSTVAHLCYEGEVAACRAALGFTPVTDWVTEWFDAPARRRYVAFYNRGRETRDPDADLCEEGSDAACISVMRGIRYYGDPITAHRRMTVVMTAIRMGGARGFERYLTGTGSPAERLAATAAAPLDSVLRIWIDHVRSARRPSRDMSTGIAMSSLGWILVCGVLALRSSRWR